MESQDGTNPHVLLELAREGDAKSLGRLLEMYRTYLSLCARVQISRRLQGKIDASDLVQETFLEASQSFRQFNGATEAELLAWLRQILVSRVAKLVRRFYGTQRRDVRLEHDLQGELDRSNQTAEALALSQSSPSERAVRREHAVLLADALTRLGGDYREVIIMRHFEDAQILAQIEAILADDPMRKIVAFACNWCSYAGGDMAGISRIQYPATNRVMRTMCSARVSEDIVLEAFRAGAPVVLVSGCHYADCHYINANRQTVARVQKLWNKIEKAGVRPERLQLEWISAAEGQKFAKVMRQMEELRKTVTMEEIKHAVQALKPKPKKRPKPKKDAAAAAAS